MWGVLASGALSTGVVPWGVAAAEDRTPVRARLADPPVFLRAEAGMEATVQRVASIVGERAPQIAAQLGLSGMEPVEIVLLRGPTFQSWARGLLPEWGVGYANWPAGPIAIDVDASLRGTKSLEQIVAHELSHVLLGQRLRGHRPPTWFVEGVAQWQSGEWGLTDTLALVQAASIGRILPLSQLTRQFPRGGRPAELAYRISLQAVAEIDRRLRDRGGLRVLIDRLATGERFDQAFEELVGLRVAVFEQEILARLRGRYGWFAAIAGAGTLFTAMSLLFLLGAARAYARKRRRLAEMGREEALAERNAVALGGEALGGGIGSDRDEGP